MRIATSHPAFSPDTGLTKEIARYWDELTEHYEFFLGHHIHLGYVEPGSNPSLDEATDRLVEELMELVELERGERILDCGCGMGATSLLLAQRFGARVTGVTLSPKQVEIARRKAEERGVDGVEFMVDDAHRLEHLEDGSFDTVWSVESCEQYLDKPLFFQQANRVLQPGGKLLMATWCSGEEEFEDREAREYVRFCKTFDCPYMPTIPAYCDMLREAGFVEVEGRDWSEPINGTWTLPPRVSSLRQVLTGLLKSNLRFMRFMFEVHRLKRGFQSGMVRYGVFTARKPA
ncbi:MAG: methyltransferase domain-containing protein [Acidobacteriota bacterium]|jgi:tocopherol O-methyltransferase